MDFKKMLKESANMQRPFIVSYINYLKSHITCVKTAHSWLVNNCKELFEKEFVTEKGLQKVNAKDLEINIANHDVSKYEIEEFVPYALYFYVSKEEYKREFDRAWNHHQKRNKHHWQYWILRQDDGPDILIEMPLEYVFEMVCDWFAFSFKKGNLFEILKWYDQEKDKIQLNEMTRKVVEDILECIKNKLDEDPAIYSNYIAKTFSPNDIEPFGLVELDEVLLAEYDAKHPKDMRDNAQITENKVEK